MNKKIIGIVSALVIMIVCVAVNVLHSNKIISDNKKSALEDKDIDIVEKEIDEEVKEEKENTVTSKKVAVVYFSLSGNTKKIAEYINENVKGTMFEIIPDVEYSKDDLDYDNTNSRSYTESKDINSRPKIKNSIKLDDYDIIYLGYPIWYNNVPRIILTFIDNSNLSGKTVIPFCTSSTNDISASLNTLKTYKSDIKWVDGKRLTDNKSDIESWISSLKY